jgi:hypothetical protein
MSVRVSTAIWQHSESTLGARLTLLRIADNANDSGWAFPGEETLATETRQSQRNVRRCIRWLEEHGELFTFFRASQFQTNVYRIVLPGILDKEEHVPFQPDRLSARNQLVYRTLSTVLPDICNPSKRTLVSDEPREEPSENLKNPPTPQQAGGRTQGLRSKGTNPRAIKAQQQAIRLANALRSCSECSDKSWTCLKCAGKQQRIRELTA